MATRKRTTSPRRRTRSAASASEERIIYIHGIGDHPPVELIKREWDLALFGREMGSRTRMAYWSDILHAAPTRARRTRGVRAADADRMLSVDALLQDAGLSADHREATELALGLLGAAGVSTADGRTKALPLPAFLRKPITRAFMEVLVKDSAAYFFRPALRTKIQDRLRALLPSDGSPVTIVAHSQGTVVALEVIRSTGAQVDQFITIGSPLGIQEVQDLLEGGKARLRIPDTIASWQNFADPLDPVALDKGLGDDFDPDRFIVDTVVTNTHTRRLQGFNPHSAAGYLAHPSVRSAVHRAIRFDSHARFLMARDVGAALAVDERHAVLIEILEPGYGALGESKEELKAVEDKEAKGPPDLQGRIGRAVQAIEKLTGDARAEARVEPLRRFVSARLTPSELSTVAHQHRDLRVYAVWKGTKKRKFLTRSARVIHADAARVSYGALGRGVRWAVLDTGIRSDHPHFTTHKTIASMWDCTQVGPPKAMKVDRDRDGHGSHVAGIIAGGAGGKDWSVTGIAPHATLDVYKVLNDQGEGDDAWIIKALDHIAERNESSAGLVVHGVNLSLGGPYDTTVYGCGFTPLCAELRRLWRNGVVVCVACGNEGQLGVTTADGEVELNTPMSIGDPANLEDCIAVGSVHADQPHLYGISGFSSRGPTSDGRAKPDVVAPGERIKSVHSRFRGTAPEDLYRSESGTSMAAPHVSGLVAAFLSARPEFRGRPDEVKALMLRTCIDLGRDRYHQGHGIPNLMRMLLEA